MKPKTEKQAEILNALRDPKFRNLSSRALAEYLGVGHDTVSRVRRKLQEEEDPIFRLNRVLISSLRSLGRVRESLGGLSANDVGPIADTPELADLATRIAAKAERIAEIATVLTLDTNRGSK